MLFMPSVARQKGASMNTHTFFGPVRHSPSASRAQLVAVRCAALLVALGIAAASALVCSTIAFGREPIGGTSGLLGLYAATAGVGIGLALFQHLWALARRLAESVSPPFSARSERPGTPFPSMVISNPTDRLEALRPML
jgi:hypothetical protein